MRSTDHIIRGALRAALLSNLAIHSHYRFMYEFGASAAELQEIAWVTYLGNVYEEENA